MQKKICFTNFEVKRTEAPTTASPETIISHIFILLGQEKVKIDLRDPGKQMETSLSFSAADLVVRFFKKEEDIAQNKVSCQFEMKTGKLKKRGRIKLNISDQGKKVIGFIMFHYEIKEPKLEIKPLENYNIIIKNLKCLFYKDIEFIFKKQPFISIICNEDKFVAQPKQNIDKRQLIWTQQFKLKINGENSIAFGILDKNDNNAIISSYTAYSQQFVEAGGFKKLHVFDKNYEPLGQIHLDFHLENVDGSPIPKPKAKKMIKQVTQIQISTLQCMSKNMQSMYYKICFGSGTLRTSKLIQRNNNYVLDLNQNFYALENQNKIVIALFQESLIKDTFIGFTQILLTSLVDGQNQLKIKNEDKEYSLIMCAKKTKVYYKILELYDIDITVHISTDIIGDSDMYLVGKIGGSVSHTEVITGKHAKFKQRLTMVYTTEEYLRLVLMDQDVFKDDTMYVVQVKLSQFKSQGDMKVKLAESNQNKTGWIVFKYKMFVSEREDGGLGSGGYGGVMRQAYEDDDLYQFSVQLENSSNDKDSVIKPPESQKKQTSRSHEKQDEKQKKKKQGDLNGKKESKKPQKSNNLTDRSKDSRKKPQSQKIVDPPKTNEENNKQVLEEKHTDPPKENEVDEKEQQKEQEKVKEQEQEQNQKQKQQQPSSKPPAQPQLDQQIKQKGQSEDQNQRKQETVATRRSKQEPVIQKQNKSQRRQQQDRSRQKDKQGEDKHEDLEKLAKLPAIKSKSNSKSSKYYEQEIRISRGGFSIPKEKRFIGEKYSGEPAYRVDSSFDPKSKKGVGFGFGNKQMFPNWKIRNMRENPAPGSYDCDSDQKYKFRGPTFGLPWSYYEKVRLPEQGPVHPKKKPLQKVRVQIKEYPRIKNLRA